MPQTPHVERHFRTPSTSAAASVAPSRRSSATAIASARAAHFKRHSASSALNIQPSAAFRASPPLERLLPLLQRGLRRGIPAAVSGGRGSVRWPPPTQWPHFHAGPILHHHQRLAVRREVEA